MKRLVCVGMIGLSLSALMPCMMAMKSAHAESFPSRPVRFIVPLGPGSGSDTITRLVARLAAQELGQPTYVENKPGADSLVAVQTLLSAPADGYNIMMLSPSSLVINPLISENLPYDPQRDLRPVAGMIRVIAVLVTGSGSRFNSFADLMTAARQAPGSVSMASYSAHYRLGALQMQQMAKVEFNHVPYKGAAPVQTDLMGGAVDVALMDIGGALPLIATGKLKVLAVTGKERHPRLPGVPTVSEAGLANYDLYGWISLGVAARTPEPVVQAIEAAVLKAMKHPEFSAYVTQNAGAEVFAVPGKEVSALVASETARYRPFARQLQAAQR
ncbi:tripartite tricarboxylate transporter substrate binding protein (plasmid) [Cupriavidus sp. KK10]|jgi:tripartite-type tricarboxylate transporter receptor subunit TctC|uniref:Bug family tripartite tricarboxylate transporter substrate binding protein n=1 Tax=Cupriavidus sp. KK10 TaxID=1478019 RepID=UPI001BA44D9B|nr:tripartite tricarboxylate transporter substrate binding protein [Cupriavidus sp. KK10]QUN32803.1 tripartite tricarboxylate transporter substrate binding protein [Cupriavidus sp. KK10]